MDKELQIVRTALKKRKQRSGLESGWGQDHSTISEKPVVREATKKTLVPSKVSDLPPWRGSRRHALSAQPAHPRHRPQASVPPSRDSQPVGRLHISVPLLRQNRLFQAALAPPTHASLAPTLQSQVKYPVTQHFLTHYLCLHRPFLSAFTDLCTHIHLLHHF